MRWLCFLLAPSTAAQAPRPPAKPLRFDLAALPITRDSFVFRVRGEVRGWAVWQYEVKSVETGQQVVFTVASELEPADTEHLRVVTDRLTGAPLSLWKGTDGDPPDVDDTPTSGWIWNELWTPDVKKALAFYERLLGYSRDSMDMGEQGTYYLLKTGDKSRGGVIQSSDPSASPMWLPYVKVADCDVSAGKAKKLGGQTLVPPTDIPTIGRFAILLDTVGAAVAIIKPEPMSS